jgi:4-hydroxybutyryl-CoA dehydratase/vinylacetyl-CoA-Delta-isomerase
MSIDSPNNSDPPKIVTGSDYLESLRGRKLRVSLFGQWVAEPVDHPLIRPSINAMMATYELALQDPALATELSPFTGERVNRFLHIAMSAEQVVLQNKMQRRLGQLTGACFQRCVGMDALNALYSVTYEIDEGHGTPYHSRLKAYITKVQQHNAVIGGAMTDVKGDRSKSPSQQADPDLHLHVSRRTPGGVYIRGAKAHQTGCINSHWLIVMPGSRLGKEEADYAIAGALPVDADGLTYVYGRQSCDTRSLETGQLDVGNPHYSGQEALVIFDDAFIPNEYIFMDGETEFASLLVERFASFHRRSYVCKSGVGDVLIGAAAAIAEYNGVESASHVRDKLVEMTFLNETIYAAGIASSSHSQATRSGAYLCDELLANVCKHHVTRIPYEMGRLAQDLAGGLAVTLPSEADYRHGELGPVLEKYLKGRADVPTEHRIRILRLIENMTLGRNAVGYLTESLHGAGSPQAQRIQIYRQMQSSYKKRLARRLAGIDPPDSADHDPSS